MLIPQVLITFVGGRDPFDSGSSLQKDGPILTMLKERKFDSVCLLHTSDDFSTQRAQETSLELKLRETDSIVKPTGIENPTDFEEIFQKLRPALQEISTVFPDAELYFSLSSGTPATFSSLLLLAASDEFHAETLYVPDPRFVNEGQPRVVEINPRAPEFPKISKTSAMQAVPSEETIQKRAKVQAQSMKGNSPAFSEALELAKRYARSPYPVLILGESGVGKELFAEYIHKASKRSDGPFVTVNCGALPATLVESELFGHDKGAFTSAISDKPGFFQRADGGTLFLDEVGDMPLEMQLKLLRTLESRKVTPLGGKKEYQVDVRILLATHCNLAKKITEGRFREDFWHRISTLPLNLPPLRERLEDLEQIADFLLKKANRDNETKKSLSREALDCLRRYTWPGNIRELGNVINRAVVCSDSDEIGPEDLHFDQAASSDHRAIPLPDIHLGLNWHAYKEDMQKSIFKEAVQLCNGNQSEAARLLNVTPQAIHKALR